MEDYKMYIRVDCTTWSKKAGDYVNIGTDELVEVAWEKPKKKKKEEGK